MSDPQVEAEADILPTFLSGDRPMPKPADTKMQKAEEKQPKQKIPPVEMPRGYRVQCPRL